MNKDYQKTIIYKFYCKDNNINDIYIGHTVDFNSRKSKHETRCNNINDEGYNIKLYQFIRNNGGWDNWNMIEIEKYPCNDIDEALDRETYWYNLLKPSLNTLCPKRSVKERYELNKEYINKEYRKKYREINGREKERELITCDCGKKLSRGSLNRHLKRNTHIEAMTKKILP